MHWQASLAVMCKILLKGILKIKDRIVLKMYIFRSSDKILFKKYLTVTPAIRIRQRPGHPGSPDVRSANGSLHFGRYSEACNGRVERFLCQVHIYFRSYYSGFYHYVLAFSNDLPSLYIARPMTKCHFAGDWG